MVQDCQWQTNSSGDWHAGQTSSALSSRRKVTGSRKIDGSPSRPQKLASSTNNNSWHIFVGKLKKDTDEATLKEWLEENGVTVSNITKIKPTQAWQEKSSAFHVSVPLKFKDLVMDPGLWPDLVDVRDWVFK